jgi:hypothetical protein
MKRKATWSSFLLGRRLHSLRIGKCLHWPISLQLIRIFSRFLTGRSARNQVFRSEEQTKVSTVGSMLQLHCAPLLFAKCLCSMSVIPCRKIHYGYLIRTSPRMAAACESFDADPSKQKCPCLKNINSPDGNNRLQIYLEVIIK